GGFYIFYMGINVGAFLAGIIVGFIGETYGWHYGFGLAGIGMALGQIVFMWGQKYLKGVGEPPKKNTGGEDDTTSMGTLLTNLLKSPMQLIATVVLIVASIVGSLYYA